MKLSRSATRRPILPTRQLRSSMPQVTTQHPIHKCKFDENLYVQLPNYPIRVFWEWENQWWNLDKYTTVHEFKYYLPDPSKETGHCKVSWKHRTNVYCKWKRMKDEDDFGQLGEYFSDSDDSDSE